MISLYRIGLFLFFLQVAIQTSNAQQQEIDVIYLKNGKTVSGKIVERIPEKTVVIETKDGIEFVDFVDIKRIQKEFIPRIDGVTPASCVSGSTASLSGSFPSSQPKGAVVTVGDMPAEVVTWGKEKIDIHIPELPAGDYPVAVLIGSQKDVARIAVTVTAPVLTRSDRGRNVKKPVEEEPESEGYDTGGFWMLLGYAMPLGEFAESDKPNSGFAKSGFSIGYESRIHLSQNFFIPLNFQVTYAKFDIEALQKLTPIPVSSEVKGYGVIWFSGGLGFAIPLSSSAFIFASADYGYTMTTRPARSYFSPVTVEMKTAVTFSGGHGFSGGITFSDNVSFGYRTYSAKPKHKVEVTDTQSQTTNEMEIEQPTDVGLIFLAISW